ncbi:hypothetical protein QQF64_023705 [Cirrhinus molitorella]|uniref:Uncharacterized protein n=1 Tax=Cirrhinus molitorella TaxID=172907 RepID=A0ABR3NJT7_9TELE
MSSYVVTNENWMILSWMLQSESEQSLEPMNCGLANHYSAADSSACVNDAEMSTTSVLIGGDQDEIDLGDFVLQEAVEALGKEDVGCLRRRDKQWTKQLQEKSIPEAAVPPPTETHQMPSTTCFSSTQTDHPAISTSSPTQDRARDGMTNAMTSTEPVVRYIFSNEEIMSAQQDDATLSIPTSMHQTDRITVHKQHLTWCQGCWKGLERRGWGQLKGIDTSYMDRWDFVKLF